MIAQIYTVLFLSTGTFLCCRVLYFTSVGISSLTTSTLSLWNGTLAVACIIQGRDAAVTRDLMP